MNEKPAGSRGATYIRVSHGEKQDPERQREVIRAWAGKRGLEIAHWYEDIVGRNPRDRAESRVQFQRLLRDVEAGRVDWIVVDSQDRWGVKDQLEFGYYGHILRVNDVQLWSVAQGHLTALDDAAVFTSTVGNVTSTREQREKGQRAISGKRRLAAIGEWQGGYVPFGHDVACVDRASNVERWRVVILKMIPKQGIWHRVIVYPDGRQERCDGDNRFPRKQDWERFQLAPSIINERVETAREVFRLFASGAWTVRGLCERLNKRGVDPVTGVGWYHTRLKPMLQNPAYYVGATVYGKNSHGRHAWYVGGEYLVPPRVKGRPTVGRRNKEVDWVFPPAGQSLIDRTLWDEVQSRLAGRPAVKRGLRDERLWLAGLVFCGRCGQRMTGRSQGGLSYCCTTYVKYGSSNEAGCRLHRVMQSKLEEQLDRYIHDVGPALAGVISGRDGSEWRTATEREDSAFARTQDVIGRMAAWLKERGIPIDGSEMIEDTYSRHWEADREQARKQLAEAEANLARLVRNLNRLGDEATEALTIQRQLIAEADAEVARLRRESVSLVEELDVAVGDALAALDSLKQLRAEMDGDDARRKALALRRNLEKVVCHFRHFDHQTKDRRATTTTVERSTLEAVEFVPVLGSGPQVFTVDNQPGLN